MDTSKPPFEIPAGHGPAPMTAEQWQAAWDRCHQIEAGLLRAEKVARKTARRQRSVWWVIVVVGALEALTAVALALQGVPLQR